MEIRHHAGKWKNRYVPSILFLLAVFRLCSATEEQQNNTCSENEYMHNDFCCDKCPPGFKLTQMCPGQGRRSTCEKCSIGTYQDNMNNFPNCFTCRSKCRKDYNEIEIRPCTNAQDRICGCQKGYYQNVVDEFTMTCEPCRMCGSGEFEKMPCNYQVNAVCECKYHHYRVATGNCALCKNCTSECPALCPSMVSKTTSISPHLPGSLLEEKFIFVGVFAPIALLCIICLYCGFKHLRKKRTTTYSQAPVSYDPEKQVEMSEMHICVQAKEDESKLLAVQPETMLPDCIPKEIKTHEFIYFVLDNVPVNRFKELVRRLNVSEQDIERAERDNRAFADAQYQMLMVWADSGTRGGKGILPRPLIQDFLDRLQDMNLTSCVEGIQEKYA